ncbi:MAG: hypothetical protein EPN25_00020 [Nitrospirae bacterium]|nr:MAG: hypothetical protein EPN25_00020 [Nitrospirota bacterium]
MTTYPATAITNFYYSWRIIFCIIVVLAGTAVVIWERYTTMVGKYILFMYGKAIAFFALAIVLKGLLSFENVWYITYMMKYITYLGDPAAYDGLSIPLPFAYLYLSMAITGTILNLANQLVPIKRSNEVSIRFKRKARPHNKPIEADRD